MFIKKQGADADAAYQRLSATRKFRKEYQDAVNATNTVDVAGELKALYDNLDNILDGIEYHEKSLIHQAG